MSGQHESRHHDMMSYRNEALLGVMRLSYDGSSDCESYTYKLFAIRFPVLETVCCLFEGGHRLHNLPTFLVLNSTFI